MGFLQRSGCLGNEKDERFGSILELGIEVVNLENIWQYSFIVAMEVFTAVSVYL